MCSNAYVWLRVYLYEYGVTYMYVYACDCNYISRGVYGPRRSVYVCVYMNAWITVGKSQTANDTATHSFWNICSFLNKPSFHLFLIDLHFYAIFFLSEAIFREAIKLKVISLI